MTFFHPGEIYRGFLKILYTENFIRLNDDDTFWQLLELFALLETIYSERVLDFGSFK